MFSKEKKPKVLSDVIGQPTILKRLKIDSRDISFSSNMLFYGPTGTGKTTCAHIVAKLINCKNPVENSEGYYDPCNTCDACKDVNEDRFRRSIHYFDGSMLGMDGIKDLKKKMRFMSMYDKNKVFIIDEAHLLSQERTRGAMLTMTERTRKNVYFMLCTMDYKRFDRALTTRFSRYPFKNVISGNITTYLRRLARELDIPEKHKKEFLDKVIPKISIFSKGSVRDALEHLDVCRTGQFWTYSEAKEALNIS